MDGEQSIKLDTTGLAYCDEGAGEPLLFVHGFPFDHSQWRHQIDRFADSRRVMALDLPGFGKSSARDPMPTIRGMADECIAFLDRMDIQSPVAIVGLSMGGYIALEIAHTHQHRMSQLALCHTRPDTDSAEVARARRISVERVKREGVAASIDEMMPRLFAKESMRSLPDDVDSMRQVMKGTSASAFIAAQQAMIERDDASAWIEEISLPVLVVAGENDLITPAKAMRNWSKKIAGAKYVCISNAGHLSPIEQPDPFNSALARFLSRNRSTVDNGG